MSVKSLLYYLKTERKKAKIEYNIITINKLAKQHPNSLLKRGPGSFGRFSSFPTFVPNKSKQVIMVASIITVIVRLDMFGLMKSIVTRSKKGER